MSVAASHHPRGAEANFLESLRAQYEGRGYRFVVHPQPSTLPAFFASYVPDAMAIKDGSNIVIEVKSRATPSSDQSIRRIRKLFDGRPDWSFVVAHMGSEASQRLGLPIADRATIIERAREIDRMAAVGDLHAAFVIAWSLLEAALNSVEPRADKRPRRPDTVVQTLAMGGYIDDETERSLRRLVDLRNRLVHGDLTVKPGPEDVRAVLGAVHAALGEPLPA